ncbi:hypothetical protein PSACC_00593 [Paramicrosporidium saccamoebae]|uniref:Uncharacterized protein n=1 Tax=Paramicrosporidium saccamoebae TaxID=1246581 RepID=A0A2H9TPF3_9FUNG|nr:hypothetical protein PSACC_00593 [Paramicrosporidium saccamoebae]
MPFRRVATLSSTSTNFSEFLSTWKSVTDAEYETHKEAFSSCMEHGELPVTQIIQNYFERIRTEYSRRDRYENKGEFMKVLVLGSRIKALYGRLVQDNVAKVSHTVLCWMNEELQTHISAWTSDLKLRVCPRPACYGQLVKVSIMLDITRDWVASFPLQLRVANSNGTIFFALG